MDKIVVDCIYCISRCTLASSGKHFKNKKPRTFGESCNCSALIYTVFQKSDAKIQITITTAYLIRIKYPLSGFNNHLSDVNVANFNKINRTVSEQQLF